MIISGNKAEVIQSVHFDSSATLDSNGNIIFRSIIANKNWIMPYRVKSILRLFSRGDLVHIVESESKVLYGSLCTIFRWNKQSSLVVDRRDQLDFDPLALDDPNNDTSAPEIQQIDQEILKLATDLRKQQYEDSPTADHVINHQSLIDRILLKKCQRMRMLKKIEHAVKFRTISLDIVHSLQIF
jgi:hypothetical protein